MASSYVFTTVYQPLLATLTADPIKLMDLPVGTILEDAMPIFEKAGEYLPVIHRTNLKTYNGYVRSKWAEHYALMSADKIVILSGTASISDAAQYVVYKGNVQYNLCGQFCAAYCLGCVDVSIEEFLDKWAFEQSSVFNRIFRGGKGRTTGIEDLRSMLYAAGKEYMPSVQDELTDPDLKRPLMTPGRVIRLLMSNRIIIGCTIEGQFGRLKRSGIPHWVAVEEITPEGRGGVVKLYNPFSNGMELYSWEEFVASVKIPYGVVIAR